VPLVRGLEHVAEAQNCRIGSDAKIAAGIMQKKPKTTFSHKHFNFGSSPRSRNGRKSCSESAGNGGGKDGLPAIDFVISNSGSVGLARREVGSGGG
jgi:hypothetical protein